MSLRSSETQSDVEVFHTCPADTGSYTVIVQNRKGSAQHTVSLSVIGETHFGLSRCSTGIRCASCCRDLDLFITNIGILLLNFRST